MLLNVSIETKKLLALSHLKGIGAKMLSSLSQVPEFDSCEIQELVDKYIPNKKRYLTSEVLDAKNYASRQLEIAEDSNHTIISSFDPSYPNSLKTMHDRPNLLFVAGNVNELNKKSITVIGTREPSLHGEEIARKITNWYANRGWNIVSGLAYGVDKLAHEECLNSPSKTIAVMAQGLEKVYPAKHKYLTDRILDSGGVLLSEYSYNSFSGRANFVQRDRIQAGLSSGVVLIQSGLKGGSLHASRKAIEYGRALVVAGQSKTDISASLDNIQANMVLLSRDSADIYNLLKLNTFDESLLIRLENHTVLETAEKFLFKINESLMLKNERESLSLF